MIDTPTAFMLSSVDCMASVNSLLISTIDSDIANISTDQFGLVFAGGIVSDASRVIRRRDESLTRVLTTLGFRCMCVCVFSSGRQS